VEAAPAASAADSGPTGIHARYAEVENAVTGAAIWSRSPDAEVPMGSITKVMTAYVVIKAGHLGRLITVPRGIIAYDNKFGASTAGLRPGQRLTAKELLYALLVPSGCDAAYTLARAYGPGRSAFIAKMSAAAARLGLSHTHFTDFSGLPDPTEYSTYSDAHDLIALGRDAMALPLFASIVQRPKYHFAPARRSRSVILPGHPRRARQRRSVRLAGAQRRAVADAEQAFCGRGVGSPAEPAISLVRGGVCGVRREYQGHRVPAAAVPTGDLLGPRGGAGDHWWAQRAV
jgi:D-alanyl-D-alanine carboxypeptidase